MTRNCLNNTGLLNDLDLASNLQALQTLKYLQQPQSMFNSLLHPACSHNVAQQVLEKFNGNATMNLVNLASEVQGLHLDRVARYHRSGAGKDCHLTCVFSLFLTKSYFSYFRSHLHLERRFTSTFEQDNRLFVQSIFGRRSMGYFRAGVGPYLQTVWKYPRRMARKGQASVAAERLRLHHLRSRKER